MTSLIPLKHAVTCKTQLRLLLITPLAPQMHCLSTVQLFWENIVPSTKANQNDRSWIVQSPLLLSAVVSLMCITSHVFVSSTLCDNGVIHHVACQPEMCVSSCVWQCAPLNAIPSNLTQIPPFSSKALGHFPHKISMPCSGSVLNRRSLLLICPLVSAQRLPFV